jgi:hypothetical protein
MTLAWVIIGCALLIIVCMPGGARRLGKLILAVAAIGAVVFFVAKTGY